MIIHIVKKDETLFSIAKEYNKNIDTLAKENGIDKNKALVVGQSIVITKQRIPLRKVATNGYLYPYINQAILEDFLPYLSLASVFSYSFDKDANIKPLEDEKVLNTIKNSITKPVMVLSSISEDSFDTNLSSLILNDLEKQDKLIENILKTMKDKDYFSLDIDFEYIAPENKDAYVRFVERATNILNKNGYPVSVSLAPKISREQKGLLYEAHSYKELGEVANSVLIMTYEWGYTFSEPMPTAPLDKIKQVLDYAVSEIPSDKIFLGIANYGYDFTIGEERAKSIGNEEAIDIARENNATILFDEKTKTPYFEYTKDDKKHIVHFEDARSVYAKFLLVVEYKLAGFSYWNIMREFTQANTILSQIFDIYTI